MEKTYDPAQIEQTCYQFWERNGYFEPSGAGEPYCIMIPPPNVTGTLHMGHAFQDTIMDALTRYHRMDGRNTLWQPGMDHAGIATQMVVERQLNAEGINRRDLGREKFVERVWQWKEHSGDRISNQLRRLGASVDWSRERFTMDEGLSQAVIEVFVRLYEDGLIYRGKRLVNWDPVLHTAVSDLEVLSDEEDGHLWHFRYPLVDRTATEPRWLIVATTRPETMLGDTAVAVHGDDPRYRDLIGRRVELPLTGRTVPVIADDYVDPEFGSGCVKITPAHDFNDYEIGQRHALPMINILTSDARLNDDVPQAYRGLDRFEARKNVVSDIDELGLLDKIEAHRLKVPRGDRSGAVVEPFLTDQWYVKAKPLAEPAIEAVASGQIRFVPENWSRTYYEWMNNIQDWCISRQLWWGHRIPAWYDDEGTCYVGRSEPQVRAHHGLGEDIALRQDEDVLDTWFSSALWPFSTLGWPDNTESLKTFYPTTVLVTGFDIIFFWVARMIMMGLRFTGQVPFRDVYIHGLIRDEDGQKMSKAKGNVLDPLDLIDGIALDDLVAKRTANMMQPHLRARVEKTTRKQFRNGIPAFGTDALRFTFASLATTGRDIRFDLGRVEGYRNFCNKLWNASRYVLMNTESYDCSGDCEYSLADRWICSRLAAAIETVREQISQYRFDLAARALYEFTWHEFCDWYLELSKPVLQSEEAKPELQRGTRRTLARVLEALLRALHPLMPFVTEEIWRRVAPIAGRTGPTIMHQPYPRSGDFDRDTAAERDIDWIRDFVLGVRQIRGEYDISPSRKLTVLLQDAGPADRKEVQTHRVLLQTLARVSDIQVLADDAEPPPTATALHGRMKIHVPMAGLIDPAAELARLERKHAKVAQDLTRSEKKLANAKFLDNAPAEVVTEERQRLHDGRQAIVELENQITRVRELLDQNR